MSESRLTRRTLLGLAATTTVALSSRTSLLAAAKDEKDAPKSPITGDANPHLASLDELMSSFIEEQKVPGAALAVTRNRKLVYARGFGYADVERKTPVQPTNLFRIASVSKPFTAVAIMQLIQKRKLKLDDHVVDYIKLEPFLTADAKPDPRWQQITVGNCLHHTGGWDRAKSYDPIGRPWKIAEALGIDPPPSPNDIVRYMLGQPLDFDPGQRYAYSNLGFLVLARVLEAITRKPYPTYVKEEVLAPLGIKAMRLGRATLANRASGEVKYYDRKNRTGPCLYPPRQGKPVPQPYGAENLEGFEAHGGWISSAVELVKFASAFDDPKKCPLLNANSIDLMWSRPDGPPGYEEDGKPKSGYYACGWSVQRNGNSKDLNASHSGFISGSESLLVRRADKLCWAVLFNTATNEKGQNLAGLIDGQIHAAAEKIKAWPKTDRFAELLT